MSGETTICGLCKGTILVSEKIAHIKKCPFFDSANAADDGAPARRRPKPQAETSGVTYMTGAYGAAEEEEEEDADVSPDVDADDGGYGHSSAPRPKIQIFRREDSAKDAGPRMANNFPVRGRRPKKEFLQDCKARWQQINHGGISIKEVNQGLKDVDPESIPQHNFCPYCKFIFQPDEIAAHIVRCAEKHRVEDDVEWTNVMNTDPSKYSGPTMAKLKQKGLLESQLEEDCIHRPKPVPKAAWPQHPGLLYPTNPHNIPLNLLLPPRKVEGDGAPQEATQPAVSMSTAMPSRNDLQLHTTSPAAPFDPTPLQAMLPVLEAVAGFVDKVRHQPSQRDMEVQTQKDDRGHAPPQRQRSGVARYNWESEKWEEGSPHPIAPVQPQQQEGPDPALYAFHSSVRPVGRNAVVDAWREKRIMRQGERKEQEALRAVSREKQRLRKVLTGGNMNVYLEPVPFARPTPPVGDIFEDFRPEASSMGISRPPERIHSPSPVPNQSDLSSDPLLGLHGRETHLHSHPQPQSLPQHQPQPQPQVYSHPQPQPQAHPQHQLPHHLKPAVQHPRQWSPTSQSSPIKQRTGHIAEESSPLGSLGHPFPAEAGAPWYPGHDASALDAPQYGRRRLALDSGDVMPAPHGGWTFSGSPPRERLHTRSKAMQEHHWTQAPLDKVVPSMKVGDGRPIRDNERSVSPPIEARRRMQVPSASYAEYPEHPSQPQPQPPPGSWWSRLAPSWMGGRAPGPSGPPVPSGPPGPTAMPGYAGTSQPVDIGYDSAEEEYAEGAADNYRQSVVAEVEEPDPVEAARARRMREMEAQRRDEYETTAAMDAVDGMLDDRRYSRESQGRYEEDVRADRYVLPGRREERGDGWPEDEGDQWNGQSRYHEVAEGHFKGHDSYATRRHQRGQPSHTAAGVGAVVDDELDVISVAEEESHDHRRPAPAAHSAPTRSRSHDDIPLPVHPKGFAPDRYEERPRSGLQSGYDNRVPCASCGRMFAADRIDTHARICRKNAQKSAPKAPAKRSSSAPRSGVHAGNGRGAAVAETAPEHYPAATHASHLGIPRYASTTESVLENPRGRLYPYEASSYAIGSETPAYTRVPLQSSYARPATVYSSEPVAKYYPSYQTPVTRVPTYSRAPVYVESSDSIFTHDATGSSRRFYPSYSSYI
eukprot:GGOE01006023.1.p1 GENE.GGOE01006023.1~~GGOE01006023.1.p1  ORF type:complete len:1157 (-),score=133.15 GGOE01006023.1:515-3985(-)